MMLAYDFMLWHICKVLFELQRFMLQRKKRGKPLASSLDRCVEDDDGVVEVVLVVVMVRD